jgi:hypothetical protein
MPTFASLARLSALASVASVASVGLVIGCGGISTPASFDEDSGSLLDATPEDTATGDVAPSDTAIGDTSVQDTAQPDTGKPDTGSTACPASAPIKGASCPKNGLECQYGSDPRIDCKTLATCQGTAWQVTAPPATCAGATPTCPTKQPMGQCTPPGLICGYGTTSCNCSCGPLCGPGSTGYWNCQPEAAGCPTTPPNAGTACGATGTTCRYQCGDAGARQCSKDGLWTTASGGPCPISTRKAKDGITYLEPAEADRIAKQVQSMKLASWIYKGALDDGRTHMGIVLEDQPPGSFAVDSRSNMVDLYGYSSMLLATAQSQQRQIEKQKKEIDALRGEIDAIKAELRAGRK